MFAARRVCECRTCTCVFVQLVCFWAWGNDNEGFGNVHLKRRSECIMGLEALICFVLCGHSVKKDCISLATLCIYFFTCSCCFKYDWRMCCLSEHVSVHLDRHGLYIYIFFSPWCVFSYIFMSTHAAAVSVWFKIALLIVLDTEGSAPQVTFYCSLTSIRAMLLSVPRDRCYITGSLCVFSATDWMIELMSALNRTSVSHIDWSGTSAVKFQVVVQSAAAAGWKRFK